MDQNKVITVQDLAKQYRLGERGTSFSTLRDQLASLVTKKEIATEHQPRFLWALDGVSFDVSQGEIVGVIGRNGSGKSTLLKILSRITEPTRGHITMRGRVGSLLEVGTGFHPELTGRENVFLNGAILGMGKKEIENKFDAIIDFAELEDFIDTPVKFYSSGMYVRLAFAVAAYLEPEILIIDEVLAVGDINFQKKCLGRIEDVSKTGRTVLFVSHNMAMIRSLCSRVVLLSHGKKLSDGDPSIITEEYAQLCDQLDEQGEIAWDSDDAPGCDELQVDSLRLLNEHRQVAQTFNAHEQIFLEVSYEVKKQFHQGRILISVSTEEGNEVFVTTDHLDGFDSAQIGRFRSVLNIPTHLLNKKKYFVRMAIDKKGQEVIAPWKDYLSFDVHLVDGDAFTPPTYAGIIAPALTWDIEKLGG